MGLYEAKLAFKEMTEQIKQEMSKAERHHQERLAKRRAKKALRQRAELLVSAVDGFEETLPERDKMLRPGVSEILVARDGLRDALDGKLEGDGG